MSYHIYTTRGLILSERPLREADRVYSILTRDLGLIRATALGVRKESSKLRGLLEPITLASVSLVRGKEYWRITSVELIERVVAKPEILRPLALLDKLVQGEAHHAELFDAVQIGLRQGSEEQFVAQILFHLGYLREEDLNLEKKDLVQAINSGLEASHLSA
ncbi:MAG: recombination protein O N-terminal domain-containing protein [Patescibacteria group bacterium]